MRSSTPATRTMSARSAPPHACSIEVIDVDASLRTRAIAAFRAATGSAVSLVDRTSFEFMRQRGIRRAWAMDADFATEGFELE